MKPWQYDESKHCGVDYAKAQAADMYDERHKKFRNFENEFAAMIRFLDLEETKDMTVIDLGCGTGTFTRLVARAFKTVHAVDISPAMLEKARENSTATAGTMHFANGGFLTYDHNDEPVDLVITKMAFHHLPDFWKQIALLKINRMLKTGGILYIHDIVFQFAPEDHAPLIDTWASNLGDVAGETFKTEIETHIRDEYSTFGWILTGMLHRAGFEVERFRSDDRFISEYLCRKIRNAAL
jgi:putative AdoMet-dependent methyltransferase